MSPPKKPANRFDLALLFAAPSSRVPAPARDTHVEREALDKPRLPAKDTR